LRLFYNKYIQIGELISGSIKYKYPKFVGYILDNQLVDYRFAL